MRSTHAAYLAFVQDGTLLSSPAASGIIRAVLETCDRFVGLVERWGGDVLPDLLTEGSLSGLSIGQGLRGNEKGADPREKTSAKHSSSQLVSQRRKLVQELSEVSGPQRGKICSLVTV